MEKDLFGYASVDGFAGEEVFGNIFTLSLTIEVKDGGKDGGDDERVNTRVSI